MLSAPHIATLGCAECKAWLIDPTTGKRKQARGRDVPRPAAAPTPCHECPKQSPERAPSHELSAVSWSIVHRYLMIRATCGAAMTDADRGDVWLAHCLAICDSVYRDHDRAMGAELWQIAASPTH